MTYRKRVAPGIYRSTQTGRYSIRYKVDGRVVDRGGYRTLEEARTARTRALADASRGIKARPKRVTVAAYAEEWLPRYTRTVRPSSLKQADSALRNYILPAWGSTPIDTLTPRGLQKWIEEVHAKVPGSTAGVKNAMTQLLQDAVHYEVLFRNPMRSVKAPRHDHRPRSTMSASELVRYLSVAPPGLCWVALTGCRVGEARGMVWADLDLLGRSWVISSTWSGPNSAPLGKPKTPASFRIVPVTSAMEALLPSAGAARDRVWGGTSYNVWRKRHVAACREIGVRGVTIHDLRHTWASLALASGVHPKLVQQQLGHSKIATTLDTYSHVMPEQTRHAAETIESLLSAVRGEGIVGGTAPDAPAE